MSNDDVNSPPSILARRTLLRSAATAGLGAILLPGRVAAARQGELPRAGSPGELDATAPGGIDLVVDRVRMWVDGGVGEAVTVDGSIPGPVIRMKEGEEAVIRVHNRMDEATSIHWHGILLPYTMDGVPGISFDGIAPGQTFTYRFRLRQNGTYWYHSHSGMQEQRGHYGLLVVDPAGADPFSYDAEHGVVLSDWTFMDPHRVLRMLTTMEGYFNFQRPTAANLRKQARAMNMTLPEVIAWRQRWARMRMDPTDIADVTGATYHYLINGKSADENPRLLAQPGQRVRLRIVNASAQTFYDVRIPGIPMTVVQADGQNVQPVEVDELRIGVAETYDVLVRLPEDRAYTLFAETADRSGYARATLSPREGMVAPVPKRRRRPMLTMLDMGMSMQMGGDDDGATTGMEPHRPHEGMKGNNGGRMQQPAGDHLASEARGLGAALPTADLPNRLVHGPDRHGPASITMPGTVRRRLDHPGAGLGDDGWRVLTYSQLRALSRPPLRRPPAREFDLHLTGNMHKYLWGFDGKPWSESDLIRFQYGERLRIHFINDTMMSHPIHLHGMWMDLYAGGSMEDNPRKHTVVVKPAELLTVDITADAPGQWAFHCHLLYHMDAGMFRTVAVVRSLSGGPDDASA